MLVKFRIYPMTQAHMSRDVAQVLEILETTDLPYELSPLGIRLEGEWDEITDAIGECHRALVRQNGRVITTIVIDDGGPIGVMDDEPATDEINRELRRAVPVET